MYYTLILITIFSVISPIFRTCFLQHYYIKTLYRHMPYSTVMKLNIIYSCAKGHTTTQFPFFFVMGKGRERMQGKRDTCSALRCNFLVLKFSNKSTLFLCSTKTHKFCFFNLSG